VNVNCRYCIGGRCSLCVNPTCLCRQSHNKTELLNAFTETARKFLPSSIEELKQILRNDSLFNLGKDKTVNHDLNEFGKDLKGGYSSYMKKMKDQYFAKDLVSNIALPGHLYNGKDSCGKTKVLGCKESHLHKQNKCYIRKTCMYCNGRGCQVCFDHSIKREAKSMTDRMITFTNLKRNRQVYLKENRIRIGSHIVISVPDCEHYKSLEKKPRDKIRNYGLKLARGLYDVENNKLVLNEKQKEKLISSGREYWCNGIDGGVMVDHAYRFTEGLESARFSPHIHSIITGWINGKYCAKVEELTKTNTDQGWVISHLSTFETEKECYSLCKYILSHSSVYHKEVGKRSAEHGVRWFGEAHNKFFKVESALKYSVDGYDGIDSILKERSRVFKYEIKEEYQYSKSERKEVLVKKKFIVGSIPLQKVDYTYSVIDPNYVNTKGNPSLGFFNTPHRFIGGNIDDLSKSLKDFIRPDLMEGVQGSKTNPDLIDNPACPQSVTLEFLQMRFDYGYSQYDIVQSVYLNIILDPNVNELCPEDSSKLCVLVPPDSGWSDEETKKVSKLLKDIPMDLTVGVDDLSMFYYQSDIGFNPLGITYFDSECMLQYDTGVYHIPDCLDSLTPKLREGVISDIKTQEFKYVFRLEHGRSPTKEELLSINVKSLQGITKSHSLDAYN